MKYPYPSLLFIAALLLSVLIPSQVDAQVSIEDSSCEVNPMKVVLFPPDSLKRNDTIKLYPVIFDGHPPYIVTWSQPLIGTLNMQEGLNDTLLVSSNTLGWFDLTAEVTDVAGCIAAGVTQLSYTEDIPIQITYTVNTTDDTDDGVCDGAHCSFREAVLKSNDDNTASLIQFNIPGEGPHIIKIYQTLTIQPDVGDVINGLSQPGNNPMDGLIVIDDFNKDPAYPYTTSSHKSYLNYGFANNNNSTLKGISFNDIDNEELFNTTGYNSLNIHGNNSLIEDNWFYGKRLSASQFSRYTNTLSIIRRNTFNYSSGLSLSGPVYTLSQNLYKCTTKALEYFGRDTPSIVYADHATVQGISQPYSLIEVYTSDNEACLNMPCQGSSYLGSTTADQNGDWALSDLTLSPLSSVTATATSNTDQNSSVFATCYLVTPTTCPMAQSINIHPEPCATQGVVMDLTTLHPSSPAIDASCTSSTYSNRDGWFNVVIPETGNVLVRANINHNLPSMGYEAFTGTCDTLVAASPYCGVLDSLPYAITFENYPAGEIIYLRVWDNDTTTSVPGDLIHLTAHELPLNKDDWEICDQENNLINGNPTILGEKDADAFILEYDIDATPGDITQLEAAFISEGLTKEDQCLCNSNPLQLWRGANAADIEIRRRSAVRRAKVDTTNNNYLFEALEFQVNVYSAGNQVESDVAMDSNGDFVITWVDAQRKHNYGRLFNSSGNPVSQEFLIGSPHTTQTQSKVAKSDDGSFVITWEDKAMNSNESYIYHRRYDENGVPTSAAIKADYSKGSLPDVSINANGDYIIVWQGLTNYDANLYLNKYNKIGNKLIDKKAVGGDGLISAFSQPSVYLNDSGQFAIAWNGEDSHYSGVHMEIYDTNVTLLQSDILVNTTKLHNQQDADIILHNDGSYIVVWESYEQEGAGLDYGIYASMFDASGTPLANEFLVNTYTTDAQKNPSISAFDDKSFFIAWDSYEQDGFAEGVFGQLFDPIGNKVGEEFQINALDDPQQEKPSTATNGNSIFMATWEDGANDGSLKGIFGQRYEKAGTNRYAIGTATPSSLLGDELIYPDITYQPINGGLANVRVAIIDTGVDPTNPWIENALWTNQQANDGENCYIDDINGYDFTDDSATPDDVDGHGTKVNGIITRDFAPGVDLDLMNLKFYENGKGTVFDALCGIYYAVDNGADIINLSWGFEASEFPAILNKALKYASDNDVLIVTSAGNTSKNNDRINKYPANLNIDNMIVVTSYEYKGDTNEKKLANYASYGLINVDIAARGFVQTPSKGDTLTISAGTSLAAPLVSRTAAIIRGLYPMLTAADVKECILSTAEQVNHLSNKVASGGILDHAAAVACALEKAGDCHQVDLYIHVDQGADATFKSDAWIQSDAKMENTAEVSFLAADHINLREGFEVATGSIFSAELEDCDPATGILNVVMDPNEGFYLKSGSEKTGKVKVQFYNDGSQSTTLKLNSDTKTIDTWTSPSLDPGWYEKIIDVQHLKSGTYEIELEKDNLSKTKRLYIDQSSNDTTMR